MRDRFSGLSFEPVGRCRCIPFPPVNEDHLLDALNYSIKTMEEHIMNEPDYYAGNGLSPIGAMKQGLISKEEYIGFLKGNILKYVVRAEHKENPVKDLLKAKSYINFYLELFTMTEEELAELKTDKKETSEALDDIERNHQLLKQELMFKELEDQDVNEEEK